MSRVRVKYDESGPEPTKTIVAPDLNETEHIVDWLCDAMLAHGPSEVRPVLDRIWLSANRHYEAERKGESEGYHVFIEYEDGRVRDLREDPA